MAYVYGFRQRAINQGKLEGLIEGEIKGELKGEIKGLVEGIQGMLEI